MATLAVPQPDADGLLGKAIQNSSQGAVLTAGSLVCLLGASLSSLGMILMKKYFIEDSQTTTKSHDIEPRIETADYGSHRPINTDPRPLRMKKSFNISSDGKPYFARYTYATGLGLYITGQLCFLLALSLIDQVLWGVLSLFSLVTNAWLSEIVLDERFTLHDFLSTCFIILGTVMVAISKPTSSSSLTIDELLALFVAPSFIVYGSLVGVLLLYRLVVVLYRMKRGLPSDGLSWVILAAVSGSVSVLLGKCTTDLVNSALSDSHSGKHSNHNFTSPSTYIMMSLFVLAALASLHATSMALAHGEALVIVPWLTVCNTGLVIFSGMFYFQDFGMFDEPMRAVVFVFGLLLSGIGGVLLQRGHPDTKHLEKSRPMTRENAARLHNRKFWNQRFSRWLRHLLCCQVPGHGREGIVDECSPLVK